MLPDFTDVRTELLRSVPLPSYPDVRVVFARTAYLTRLLREFAPDVVHLASPFVLGSRGVAAANALRVPSVAIYQTDMIAYAEKYGVVGAVPLVARHVARLHRRATLTLAPSSAAIAQLEALVIRTRVSIEYREHARGRGRDPGKDLRTPSAADEHRAPWPELLAAGWVS